MPPGKQTTLFGRTVRPALVLSAVIAVCPAAAHSQTYTKGADRLPTWLPLQAIPNILYYSAPDRTSLGLDWEFTPILYSFGMTDQISPWYTFIVEPTARFVGSLELDVAGQFYTAKVGTSHFGFSGSLMGFVPLIETGEHLTLNLGGTAYWNAEQTRFFKVVGVSTAFGMLHLNVKHADRPTTWITALEVRIF